MAYTLPDKPSIAVLPFDNLSGDPAQDYLGDGITENIIAVLATSPDLFVIARNSSFTYKGKAVQVQEAAERFGVRYVLEGSVQRAGDWLRVTAQLVNAIDGQHLWAERYDRELDNLFALQDEIAQEILVAMDVKLTMGGDGNLFWERTKDLETYRLVVQWRSHIQSFSPEGHWEAERLCWEVLQRQPDGVAANSAMAWQYWHKVILELSSEPAADIFKSREYAEKAQSYAVAVGVAYSPDTILAQLDILERKYETAIAHAERALERSPADGATTALAGWVKVCDGQPEEGVKLMRLAMRTEPDYPQWIPMSLLTGLMMLESFDEAKEVANGLLASRIESAQAHSAAYRALAIMAYHEGNTDGARAYVGKVLELEPKQTVAGLRRAMNLKDRAYVERDLKALAHSGMPE